MRFAKSAHQEASTPASRPSIASIGSLDVSTPVLALAGKENSLSIVRNLGRHGIGVRVSGRSDCWGLYSRFCRQGFRVPRGSSQQHYWHDLLFGPGSASLHGHIIMACSDEALEFVAAHRDALQQHYTLPGGDAALHTALLDKQATLELARKAGTSIPQFWRLESERDLEIVRANARLPVMVKPMHSHKFSKVFGCKLFIIEHSFDELVDKVRLARAHDLDVMIVEMVPGPDELLSSYYTYVDENGRNLFHYTKRVLRRYPVNRGNACYHITEWLPETAEAGRSLFEKIGFRGLGNVEFKRDTRDGKLKLIEVNPRFTAAQELLVRSGAPIDLVVYCHLTGQVAPLIPHYEQMMRFWYPGRDLLAFLELRSRGELDLKTWLASVMPYRHVYPLSDWRDPLPTLGVGVAMIERLFMGQS